MSNRVRAWQDSDDETSNSTRSGISQGGRPRSSVRQYQANEHKDMNRMEKSTGFIAQLSKLFRSIRFYTVLITLLLVLVPMVLLNVVWMTGYIGISANMVETLCDEMYQNIFSTIVRNHKGM